MDKICENCGCAIPEGKNICESCGTIYMTDVERAGKGRLRIKWTVRKVLFCVIVAASLFALILLGSDLNREIYEGGGYESAIENLEKCTNGSYKRLKSLAPKEYWDVCLEEGFDVDVMIESAAESKEEEEKAASIATCSPSW